MRRCAIVGVGAIVEDAHVPVFRALPQIELTAVCDTNEDRADAFGKRHGIRRVVRSLDEVLSERDRVDFVDIATPPHTHYPLAMQALEAGLDVLVEKPLALTAREARELNRAARVRELKLCVFQNYRFRPSVLRVQRLLKEGALGRLSQVTAVSRGDDPFAKRASWSWDGTADKLLLYELGIHYIDLAIQFAGPIKEITGFQSAVSPELGATTQIRALTRHESGAAGVIDFQVLAASNFVRLEVLGSEQDVLIKFFPEVFRLHRGWVTPLVELRSDSRRIWDFVVPKMWEKVRKPEVSRRLLPHFLIVKGFLESLEHPELDPPVTAESILPTLDALDVLHAHACEEQKKHISPV